jgi:hypothetical protein
MPGLVSPVPGTLRSPVPTTLGAATGQVQPSRRKTGFMIGGAVVVAAAVGGILLVVKKSETSTTDTGSNGMPVGSGSAQAAVATGSATKPPDPPPVGSAAGSAVGSATATVKTPDPKGSAAVPDIGLLVLTLESTPPGAEVFVDGVDLHKQTNTTLSLPATHAKAEIRLRLKNYEDFVFGDVVLEGKELKQQATMVAKKVVPPGTGHGSGHSNGHGPATGKGSGHKDNDTGLMRPEDL